MKHVISKLSECGTVYAIIFPEEDIVIPFCGHAWPNGTKIGMVKEFAEGEDTPEYYATETIVDFFDKEKQEGRTYPNKPYATSEHLK